MAISTKVGTLLVEMALNSAAFQSQTTKTMDSIERSAKRTANTLSGVTTVAKGFFAAFSVQQISAVTVQALKWAGSIKDTAAALGATTTELQEYRFAAEQSGVAAGDMDEGLRKLNSTMGLALTGGKAQTELFKSLGIELRNSEGKARPLGDVLSDVASRLSAIENPATRAAVAGKLFGEELGPKLLPLLSKGKEGIDGLKESARQFGVVLSSRDIANAEEAAKKMGALHSVLQTKIASTVAENAGAISSLATSVTELAVAGIKLASVDPQRTQELMGVLGGAAVGSRFGPLGAIAGGATGGFVAASDQRRGSSLIFNDAGGGLSGKLKGAWDVLTSSRDTLIRRAQGQDFMDSLWARGGPITTGGTDAASSGLNTSALEKLLAGLNSGGGDGKKVKAAAKAAAEGLTLAEIAKLSADGGAWSKERSADLQSGLVGTTNPYENDLYLGRVDLTGMMESATTAAEQFGATVDAAYASAAKIGKELSSNLAQAIVYGQGIGTALVNSFKAAAAEALANGLFKLLLGDKDGGGLLSGVISSISNLFSGKGYADGGRPPLGMASVVGERGPELFVPDVAGTVIPNHALNGAAAGTTINVDARGASDPQAVGRAVLQASVGLSSVVTDHKIADSRRLKLGTVLG